MPPAPQQQQGQGGDNSLAALWISVLAFIVLGVIWYLFRVQITAFVVKIAYAQAVFVMLFTDKIIPLANTLRNITAMNVPVSIHDLGYILTEIGQYFRYPLGLVLLIMAIVLFLGHPTMRFKRTHTMKTLLDQERFNWPQINPVSSTDLVKIHVEKGPWSMALTPLQFAKKYKLLYEEHEKSAQPSIGKERGNITVGLLRAEAHQVFAMQLGSYWQGVDRLPMHMKALFAVFACRGNRDADTPKELLDQLAMSSVGGELDFTGVDEAVKKFKDSPLVTKVVQSHAFVITVMASMLLLAREDGVVASADFLWLKLVDRPMWYMLNAVGRQTPPAEISGAFAHWLAEKKLGRRISVPMVEEAVKALEIAVKEVVYVPDEEQR